MAEIKVPELAESITEGTIAQLVKKVGDRVEKGEFIVELETDKVNAEIISEEAGILTQITAEEGYTVLVGQVIAVVEAGEGAPHVCARKESKAGIWRRLKAVQEADIESAIQSNGVADDKLIKINTWLGPGNFDVEGAVGGLSVIG